MSRVEDWGVLMEDLCTCEPPEPDPYFTNKCNKCLKYIDDWWNRKEN